MMEEGMKGDGVPEVLLGKTMPLPAATALPNGTLTTATTDPAAAATQTTSPRTMRERMNQLKQVQKKEFIKLIGKLGRVGYVTKGIAYGLQAGIAVFSVIQGSTASATSVDLFGVLGSSLIGITVLIAMITGLMCYASWRLFEGLFLLRVPRNAPLLRRIVSGRVVPLASCIFYCIFSLSLILIIIDAGGATGISTAIAGSVAGQVCLVLAGIIMFAVAIEQVIGVFRKKYMRDMDRKALKKNKHARRAVLVLASLGIPGRALLFALLGVLFIRLAVDSTLAAAKTSGWAEAIGQFQSSVWGIIILMVVAVGLIFFMLWCWTQARYKLFLNEGEAIAERRFKKRPMPPLPPMGAGRPLSLPAPPVPAQSA